MANEDKLAKLTQGEHWFRYFMPYQLIKIDAPNAKHAYLPVNRKYKPLGQLSREWVEYGAFASRCMVFSRDPHSFPNIWTDADKLYLYNDNPSSRKDYFQRLERLMLRSVTAYKAET